MSLLDGIGTAKGTPAANYLQGGRTVLKVSRVLFREADADLNRNSFRLDGEILKSTNSTHQEQVGMSGTVNFNFRFPQQDLAKMRRALAAAGTAAGLGSGPDGRMLEAEINKAKADELCGQNQPLVGAIVTAVAVVKPQKAAADKVFTHYEIEVPTEADLDGLFGD